eukprot:m.335892 g.335892  ORF g.335892 m.335892 type:complete len:67 (+) comp20528_c0_seq2:743-943(+)
MSTAVFGSCVDAVCTHPASGNETTLATSTTSRDQSNSTVPLVHPNKFQYTAHNHASLLHIVWLSGK